MLQNKLQIHNALNCFWRSQIKHGTIRNGFAEKIRLQLQTSGQRPVQPPSPVRLLLLLPLLVVESLGMNTKKMKEGTLGRSMAAAGAAVAGEAAAAMSALLAVKSAAAAAKTTLETGTAVTIPTNR